MFLASFPLPSVIVLETFKVALSMAKPVLNFALIDAAIGESESAGAGKYAFLEMEF